MTDVLRDTYAPWPSDSEPGTVHEVDAKTLRAAAMAYQPPLRTFKVAVEEIGGVQIEATIEAATLAEALEKAAAAIRR